MAKDAKDEIKKELDSFKNIKESQYLCARFYNKQCMGMKCDCEFETNGSRGCGETCLNRNLLMECPDTCSLGNQCSNKQFQKIENAPTEVFKTGKKGFGLRASAKIPAETFIMEYVGEIINESKFQKRAKKYSNAQHFYFMALSSKRFIDASLKGNISRFINHSCNPNAETQKWTVNGELRIGFFSKKTIVKGDEITIDYKYEKYGKEAQKCYCGEENCCGWVGGNTEFSTDNK